MPDIKMVGRGLRGESYFDGARRTGAFGVLPTDDDATVIGKVNADASASAGAAEDAREEAAASAASLTNAINASFASETVQAAAVSAGMNDVSEATVQARRGVLIDPIAGVFRYGQENFGTIAQIISAGHLTVTRAGAAYLLNENDKFESFATDVPRIREDRGLFVEPAAEQLSPTPVDFVVGAWPNLSGAVVRTTGQTPTWDEEGLRTGTLIEANTISAYGIGRTRSMPTSGSFVWSLIIKPITPELTMNWNGAGSAQTISYYLDFTDPDNPTITYNTGSTQIDAGIDKLADGLYRVWIARTATTDSGATQIRKRTGTTTVGEDLFVIYHDQVEAGVIPSTPIVTGSSTRAADVADLALPAGTAADLVRVSYEGGLYEVLRGSLPDFDEAALGSGPWVGSFITQISLSPAIDRRVAADSENGCEVWACSWDGTFYFDGAYFATEEEMVSAMGGSGIMTDLALADYVEATARNWLAGVDFSSDVQGWTLTNAYGYGSVDGGFLRLDAVAAPAADHATLSRNVRLPVGRAYRFSALTKSDGAIAGTLRLGTNNSTFGLSSASLVMTSAEQRLTAVRSIGHGQATANGPGGLYVGMYIFSGTGWASFNDPILQEIRPARNFPQIGEGGWMAEFILAMPGSLPGATQIIAEGCDGTSQNYARLELRADGSIIAAHRADNGTIREADTTDGSAGEDGIHAIFGADPGGTRAAAKGVGAEGLAVTVGFSQWRHGRGISGSDFGGAMTNWRIWKGLETLEWMKRQSSPQLIENLRVWMEGDSYGADPSTGIGNYLLKYDIDVIGTSIGGATAAEEAARMVDAANLANFAGFTRVWYDGDTNGHTNSQYALELGYLEAWNTAAGNNRWLWCMSGRIGPNRTPGNYTLTTATGQALTDMLAMKAAIIAKYGAGHVWDEWDILKALAISDPTNPGYAADQSDVQYGYFPRSILSDGIHHSPAARRIAAPYLAAAIKVVSRL